MNVEGVLELLAVARVVGTDWDASPDLNWFSYTFGAEMIFAFFLKLALSRHVSVFGEHS